MQLIIHHHSSFIITEKSFFIFRHDNEWDFPLECEQDPQGGGRLFKNLLINSPLTRQPIISISLIHCSFRRICEQDFPDTPDTEQKAVWLNGLEENIKLHKWLTSEEEASQANDISIDKEISCG